MNRMIGLSCRILEGFTAQEKIMFKEIQALINELEDRKSKLQKDLEVYSIDQLRFQPVADRQAAM